MEEELKKGQIIQAVVFFFLFFVAGERRGERERSGR